MDSLSWITQLVNRELWEFTVQLARDQGLNASQLDVWKTPHTLRLTLHKRAPAITNRCQARLLKNHREDQCSHHAKNDGLCTQHLRKPLKYGRIEEDIPQREQYRFSSLTMRDSPSAPLAPIFALLPTSPDCLERILLYSRPYWIDRPTNFLYTMDLAYIGRLTENGIQRV